MPLVDSDRFADWGRSTDSENFLPEQLVRQVLVAMRHPASGVAYLSLRSPSRTEP